MLPLCLVPERELDLSVAELVHHWAVADWCFEFDGGPV